MDCALIIPTYPPHFKYNYALIDKLQGLLDIILVFTNEDELALFERQDSVTCLILPNGKYRNLIVSKKFYALEELKDSKYSYLIVCDSELDVVIENLPLLSKKIENYFDAKILFGGQTNDPVVEKIISCSSSFYGNADYLYTWFSDLPVYRRADLTHFFSTFDRRNLVWEHFDYLVYSYYLIKHHDFKVIDLTLLCGLEWSLERLKSKEQLQILEEHGLNFCWTSQFFFHYNKKFLIEHGLIFIFHLDRE